MLTAKLRAVGTIERCVGTMTSLSPPDMETRVTSDMTALGSDHTYIPNRRQQKNPALIRDQEIRLL